MGTAGSERAEYPKTRKALLYQTNLSQNGITIKLENYSFSTQPNQFEQRRNSNESESDNKSISGEEGMEENTNYVYVTEYLIHCKYQ